MTERVDTLRAELQRLYELGMGDEGLLLTRATKADHKHVAALATEVALDRLVIDVAVGTASAFGERLVQEGLRPADYWQDPELAPLLAKRLAKALSESEDKFTTAFQAVLRGQG